MRLTRLAAPLGGSTRRPCSVARAAQARRKAAVRIGRLLQTPAAAAPAAVQAPSHALASFLEWLLANGVTGIGQEDSRVALFEADGGERGLVCEERISAGEVVLEVPLRLALTDHPADDESNQLLYEGAPWSVRLACKLLRHKALGAQSPWHPYIQVLPTQVPAPLETFGWEDIAALRYPPLQQALHSADWLRADALAASSDEARGGLGEEELRWALSVVHSRTFANAAPGGGVGVRMLVPLIDMLNHGGDQVQPQVPGQAHGPQAALGLSGKAAATDNVRWDLVPADRSSTGGWAMVLSATADVRPGQELLLSYGERANDDFFMFYGFVPRANPHDDAVLWDDLEAALEWHYSTRERLGLGTLQLSADEAEPRYRAALEAGAEEEEAQQQQPGAPQLPEEVARQLKQVKVVAGGQVSAAVVRAFTAVSGGDAAAAERAIALRCLELLLALAEAQPGGDAAAAADDNEAEEAAPGGEASSSGGGSGEGRRGGGILGDMAALVADADARVVGETAHEPEAGSEAAYWAQQLRGYQAALLPGFASLLPEAPALMAASAAAAAAAAASPAAAAVPSFGGAATGGIKAKYGRPPSAEKAALVAAVPTASPAPAADGAAQPSEQGGALPLGQLVRALLPSPGADAARGGGAGAGAWALSGPQRLSLALRSYKAMVLWEVVLGSCGRGSVSPGALAAFGRGGAAV